MLSCWKKNPKERPNFTELRLNIDKLLENVSDYLHLGVTTCREMNFKRTKYGKNKKTNSSDRYVKS